MPCEASQVRWKAGWSSYRERSAGHRDLARLFAAENSVIAVLGATGSSLSLNCPRT